MKYELTKTQLRNGKFIYEVKDENENVISNRTSNRSYVACTIDGSFYFGRLDLIGKGDHGRLINDCIKTLSWTNEQYKSNFITPTIPFDEYKLNQEKRLRYRLTC